MVFPSPIPSYVLGSVFIGFGILGIVSPKKDYEVFGLPLESPSPTPSLSDEKTVSAPGDGTISPYVYAKGLRDLTYGLLYCRLQAQGHDAAITTLTGILCLTALGDGLIVWLCGGDKLKGKAWAHWGTLIGLAAWVGWRVYQY